MTLRNVKYLPSELGVVKRRLHYCGVRSLLLLLLTGCVGTSAVPPTYTPPPQQVDGDEGVNALAKEACGARCNDPLPLWANALQGQRGDTLFLEVEPLHCKIPGFQMIPMECVATCGANGMQSLTIDFGPVGETTQSSICRALERERGSPVQGTCGEACTTDTGCTWSATDTRPEVKLVGHVEVACTPK